MVKVLSREIFLFLACVIFTGTVSLVLLDMVIMPYFTRKGQQVEVPNVLDLTPVQASRKLARFGLRLKLQDPRWDSSIPEGHILLQNPAAFSRVKQNRTIYAVPSLGNRLHQVPDLRGRSLREARLWVQQSNLEIGEITEEESEKVKDGLVISQWPPPDKKVGVATLVSLVISNGPTRTTVQLPDLVGISLNLAKKTLASIGILANEIRYEFSTAYPPNIIILQIPGSGQKVKRGTGIRLIVSKL